jgi:hypothetical protein
MGDEQQLEKLLLCLLVNATLAAQDTACALRILTRPYANGATPAAPPAAMSSAKVVNGSTAFRLSLTRHAVAHQQGAFSATEDGGQNIQMVVRLPAADETTPEGRAGVLLAFILVSPDSPQAT